jgi:hypothetical protein
MSVNTTKVKNRRKVEYASFDELLADARRFGAGPIKTLGNWSPGQIFRHLALSYNQSVEGFPICFPWHMRLVARLFKKKFLSGSMPAGFSMPAEVAREVAPPVTSVAEGLAELEAAIARLKTTSRRGTHPMFGQLTPEEWNAVHLKHASLHMSFLVAE